MVLFHIVGVGASLQLRMFILDLVVGPAATDAELARKRMFSPAKTYASEPPPDKPLWSMGSSYILAVRLCILAASLPLEKQTCCRCQLCWLLNVMIPWLPEAVRAVAFAGQQHLHAPSPPFFDLSLSSPLPFQHVPAPRAKLFLRAVPPELSAHSPPFAWFPSLITAGHWCPNWQCLIVVNAAVSDAKNRR